MITGISSLAGASNGVIQFLSGGYFGDDAEVNHMLVGVARDCILGVKGGDHAPDDGDIGRVGPFGGVVVALECSGERR